MTIVACSTEGWPGTKLTPPTTKRPSATPAAADTAAATLFAALADLRRGGSVNPADLPEPYRPAADGDEPAADIRTPAELAAFAQLSPADTAALRDFVSQLTRDFDGQVGTDVSAALLPAEDEKLLLQLFEYPLNNIGNPDGDCRYGFGTRGFELDMISHVLAYLKMKPYGGGDNVDPTSSFGYFTLGEHEALLWAARASTRMFETKVDPTLVKDDVAIVTVGRHSNQVYAAAALQGMTVVEHAGAKISKTFANTSGNYGSKAFLVALYIDEASDVERLADMIREARGAKDGDDKPYPVFVHVQSSTVAEVRRFSQDHNVLLRNSGKHFAFPAVPDSPRYGRSGEFYVDSVSISKARTVKDSLCLSIGQLLTTVENKKFFNDVKVAYIDAEDSTVVGSSNGTYLMIDWYTHHRIPSRHHLREIETGAELAPLLHMHKFFESAMLEKLFGYLSETRTRAMGYPANLNFDYTCLNGLFSLLLKQRVLTLTESKLAREVVVDMKGATTANGTPYVERFIEDVVGFFKNEVWFKKDADRWDGYVTTGGTEGNYAALFLASKHFGAGKAKLFMTQGEAHYSVPKGAALFGLPVVQVAPRAGPTGEMDAEDLLVQVTKERAANPGVKIVVCLNTASTMKAALDHALLADLALVQAGVPQADRWLHVDGAFQASVYAFLDRAEEIMPFMKAPTDRGYVKVNSISTSVHKHLGSPIPAGICLFDKQLAQAVKGDVRKALQEMIPQEKRAEVEGYFNTFGTVTTGTDNGVLAAIVWARVKELGYSGLQALAKHSVSLSKYAYEQLEKHASLTGVKPYRNKNANIVTMRPSPSWRVLNTFGLPSDDGESHIDLNGHIGRDIVDNLIKDMIAHPSHPLSN